MLPPMAGLNRKHSEPPLQPNRGRLPTISLEDAHLSAVQRLGWENGWCPSCGTEAFLYGASPEFLQEKREAINGRGPMASLGETRQVSTWCALCDLSFRPSRRRHAVLKGYIWYLIVSEAGDAVSQATINRSLWAAANGAVPSSRELRRAELRRRLAQAMNGKAYLEASVVLAKDQTDEMVLKHLQAILPDQKFRDIKTNAGLRRAVLGTLGMDFLLREVEQQKITPEWQGRERFFLTDRGLELLAAGRPLGLTLDGSSRANPLDQAERVS